MRKHHRHNYNASGGIRKKGGTGNGNDVTGCINHQTDYKEFRDNRHSGEIPVCRILNEAIEDIFPELKDYSMYNHNQNQQCKSLQQKQRPQSVCSTSSTIGRMFRLKLLNLRRSSLVGIMNNDATRLEDVDQSKTKNDMQSSGQKNSISNGENPSSTTVTATKKKRKRKKKKKQQILPANFSTTITPGNSDIVSTSETKSPKGKGTDDNLIKGKSMMSVDHSLEALDEAIKNESEKMIELEANHQFPLLDSLPSDDVMQTEEHPSRFIEKIIPQEDNSIPFSRISAKQSSANNIDNGNSLSIPEDIVSNKKGYAFSVNKNPLQLSFLTTAYGRKSGAISNNGYSRYDNNDTTTSNIEQNYSGRETTRKLFHEWIDQFFILDRKMHYPKSDVTKGQDIELTEQTDDWDSYIEFCNQFTMGKEKGLGISFQDLNDIASSIQCQLCRDNALSEIKKLAGKGKGAAKTSRVVMKSSLLEKPSSSLEREINNIASAFDYVALEEGNFISLNSNPASTEIVDEYNCSDEETLEFNLSFVVADLLVDSNSTGKRTTNNKKRVVSNVPTTDQYLFFQEITGNQIDNFLYEWLIAGVDEEALVQMSVKEEEKPGNEPAIVANSKKDDVARIAHPVVASDMIKKNVTETQQYYMRSFDELDFEMQKLGQEWRSDQSQLNLDFTGVGNISHCEQSCDKYFTECIVPILTEQLSLKSHACADTQIHLWTVYLRALGIIFNACDTYYKILGEDLADQNTGKIPFLFVSAPFRSLYRNFAREKILAITDMGKSFAQGVTSSKMREFYTRLSWDRRKPDESCEECKQLDNDCRKLIQVLTEWTKIIQDGRLSAINMERRKRLEFVFDILRVVAESLGKEYDKVDKYFSKEQNDYFTSLLSNIHLANGVKKQMRLIEKEDVMSLTTGIILMWRHVRIMQSRVSTSSSLDTLPLSLHQWILQPSRIDTKNDDLFHCSSKCWPGSRQVMGILAGLTYIWLRERCNEWKAEKTSQELLTDFDLELSSGTHQQLANTTRSINKSRGTSARSSKKNKKKNSELASSVVNVSSPKRTNSVQQGVKSVFSKLGCAGDDTTVVNTGQQGLKNDLDTNDKKDKNTDTIEIVDVANTSEADDFEFVDGGISGRKIEQHGQDNNVFTATKTAQNISNHNIGESSHMEQGIRNNIESHETSIVVKDESGCSISAVDFLTDRLVSLMCEPENKNIVIIPI